MRATLNAFTKKSKSARKALREIVAQSPDVLVINGDFVDEGSPEAPTPRIRLWLENIWDYADGDEEIFLEEVHTTLLHEIGHLLGWGEEEIEDRGLG